MATSAVSSSSSPSWDSSAHVQSTEQASSAHKPEQPSQQKGTQAVTSYAPISASKENALALNVPTCQKQQFTKPLSVPPSKPAGSVMTLRELEADLFNSISPSRLDGPPSPPSGVSIKDLSLLGGCFVNNNTGSPPKDVISCGTGKSSKYGFDVFASGPSYYSRSPSSSSSLDQLFLNNKTPELSLPLPLQPFTSTLGNDKTEKLDCGHTLMALASPSSSSTSSTTSKQPPHQIGSGSVCCSASVIAAASSGSPFYCASNASVGGRQVAEFQVSGFAPPKWNNHH